MKFRSILLSSGAVLLCLNVVGCASIVNGTSQKVAVESWYEDEEIEGAECIVRSAQGRQQVVTPSIIDLKRSGEDLRVECKKEALPKGSAVAESNYSGWLLGNILLGGLIGLGIDALTGAGHNYPETVPVNMGEKIVVDKNTVYSVKKVEENKSENN